MQNLARQHHVLRRIYDHQVGVIARSNATLADELEYACGGRARDISEALEAEPTAAYAFAEQQRQERFGAGNTGIDLFEGSRAELHGTVERAVVGADVGHLTVGQASPERLAVVGTVRPRLFIAERVLDSLSEEELIAAIAHECGHVAARDNLKRLLIRACRDMLAIVPCGRAIDRAWAENAEAAADEHAAERGSAVALNLASALIEIARMVPAGARPTMPAAVFILGDDDRGVMGRVNRLIALAGTSRRRVSRRFFYWAERLAFLVLLAGLLIAVTNTQVLTSLHIAMERIVEILS